MDSPLDQLIRAFAKLPGLGPRSARRVVLHLFRHRQSQLAPLISALQSAVEQVRSCSVCGNLDAADPCGFCTDARRDRSVICVVEDIPDVWAIERSRAYKGQYHVLGGTLSAMDARGPEQLRIDALLSRAASDEVREVILATNATLEGQTTAHYLAQRLESCGVALSRLAQGIPMGGELDYLDEGTLGAALKSRH